ncbi:hypothetical protein QQM79_15600 [Marinobacteraceae bacterium S3BR75-40.1]
MRAFHLIIGLLTVLTFTGYAGTTSAEKAWYPETSGYSLSVAEVSGDDTHSPLDAAVALIGSCLLALLSVPAGIPLPRNPLVRMALIRYPELPQGPPLSV